MIVPFRLLKRTAPLLPHRTVLAWRTPFPSYTPRRTMSVFNSSRLENKVVLVTGASAGIGAVRVYVPFTRESY